MNPRLGRYPQKDARNLLFPVVRGIDDRRPRSWTWALDRWLDQGYDGACVGFSFAHSALARPSLLQTVTEDVAKQIYFEAQKIDPWEGGAYDGANPHYEGTSVLAGAKIAQSLGHFKTYEWASDLNSLILAIGYKGPAIIGVNWWSGMFGPDVGGYIWPTGNIEGGHAIVVVSVNLKGSYFVLHNSWGRSWGVDGRCRVTFDVMEKLLNEGGEACVPLYRRMPYNKDKGSRTRIPD